MIGDALSETDRISGLTCAGECGIACRSAPLKPRRQRVRSTLALIRRGMRGLACFEAETLEPPRGLRAARAFRRRRARLARNSAVLHPKLFNPKHLERPFDVATEDVSMAGGAASGPHGGSSVAGRYASALFDLATEQRQVPDVEAKLIQFQQLLDANPDLQRLVRSPVFSADEQQKAITAIVERAGIGGLGGNFLKLIAKNRRLFAVPDMIKSFRALAARARGEIQAEVTSAMALNPAQVQALKDTLRTTVGKDVQIIAKVDPTLLGGLIVKVGSRMIDSSLRTKLSTLKARMKEVR